MPDKVELVGPGGPEKMATLAGNWAVPCGGETLFTWDYDQRSTDLLALYAKGKQRQWDAETRLDWDHEVDPDDPLGMPDNLIWIAGSDLWDRLPARDRSVVRRHTAAWLYSQFLHGEQGALVCAAKVVQSVPDMDAKFYASTQVMDEARHVEAYERYLRTKIGLRYGISSSLQGLLDTIIRDSRWDFTYLGIQVLLEGLALASFSMQRDHMGDPLAKAFNAYVLEDEARHVAFGIVALRRYYQELSTAELREREQFAIETCWALRDRFLGEDMWRTLDYGAEECIQLARRSPAMREFRNRLFSRVIPSLRRINLYSPRMQEELRRLGVLRFAELDPGAISADDERIAAEIERLEMARRGQEVAGTIALGQALSDRRFPRD